MSSLCGHGLNLQEMIQEELISRRGHDPKVRNLFTEQLDGTFKRLVTLVAPELVLEIGAHEASFSMDVAKNLPDAEVHAFEANPTVFERFEKRARNHGIQYSNLAVLNAPGTIKLMVPLNDSGGEILTMGSSRQFEARKSREHVVEATSLDVHFSDSSKSSVVWIDVEGAAHDVISGGEKFLANCKMAYLEVERVQKWKDQKVFADVVDLLGKHGLVPVARDVQRPSWQFNVIFMTPDVASTAAVSDELNRHFQFMVKQ